MNFKVRCIANKGSKYFTVGGEYAVKEGVLYDSTGSSYGTERFGNVDEINAFMADSPDFGQRFELVEEKPFTKDDLKVGYVTKNRRGEFEMLMPTQNGIAIVGAADNGYLDGFEPDMTFGLPEYDIMEVYGYVETGCNALEVSSKNRPLLWKRNKITELTAEEAYKIIAEKKGVPVESLRVKWEG